MEVDKRCEGALRRGEGIEDVWVQGGGGEGGGRKKEMRAEIIAKTGIRIRTPFEYSAAITAQPQHVLVLFANTMMTRGMIGPPMPLSAELARCPVCTEPFILLPAASSMSYHAP